MWIVRTLLGINSINGNDDDGGRDGVTFGDFGRNKFVLVPQHDNVCCLFITCLMVGVMVVVVVVVVVVAVGYPGVVLFNSARALFDSARVPT